MTVGGAGLKGTQPIETKTLAPQIFEPLLSPKPHAKQQRPTTTALGGHINSLNRVRQVLQHKKKDFKDFVTMITS